MTAKFPGYNDYVNAVAQANLSYSVITALVASVLGWVIYARSWGPRWIALGRITGVALFLGFTAVLCLSV